MEQNLSKAEEFINKLKTMTDELNNLNKSIENYMNNFFSSINIMSDVTQSCNNMIDSQTNALQSQVETLQSMNSEAEETKSKFNEVADELSSIGSFAMDGISAIGGFIGEVIKLSDGYEDFQKSLNDVKKQIEDNLLAPIGDQLLPILSDMVDFIVKSFSSEEMKESFGTLSEVIGDLLQGVLEFIELCLPGLINGFKWIMDNSSIIISGIMGIVTALLAMKVSSIIDMLVSSFGLLNTTLSASPFGILIPIILGVVSALITLWNTNDEFREAIIGAWQSIKAAAEGVWNWLINVFTQYIPSAISGLVNNFRELPSKFLEIGQNIISGLWDGISNKIDWIINKIKGFCGSIYDSFKNFFKINSPSKLFRDEIGIMLVRGIAVGVDDETPSLGKIIENDMSKIVAKCKSTVAIEVGRATESLFGINYPFGNSVVTNNDNGVVQNITIVNPQRTPSENARAIRKAGRELVFG